MISIRGFSRETIVAVFMSVCSFEVAKASLGFEKLPTVCWFLVSEVGSKLDGSYPQKSEIRKTLFQNSSGQFIK